MSAISVSPSTDMEIDTCQNDKEVPRAESHERGGYLICFRACRPEFWYQELDSLLIMEGLNSADVYDKQTASLEQPFLRCWFPSENKAKAIAERSAMIRFILQLWGWGKSYEEVHENIRKAPSEYTQTYLEGEGRPWRMDAMAFGKKLNMKEQEDRRQKINGILNLKGPIRMRDENLNQFYIIENILPPELNQSGKPLNIFFGRLLGCGMIGVIEKLTLKKRRFLGPTSTETELSFLMANQGKVRKGKLVFDPFVGTGSLLIPCAYFGAYCYGSDIDARILEGKNQKNAFSNFAQYNLPFPDLSRMDFSPLGSCIRVPRQGLFDAIICDPPYGIRAGARKSGSKKEIVKPIEDKHLDNHIPATQVYDSHDLMPDLVENAARLLVVGGRLVYLLPVATETYSDDVLPKHPCMKVIANSEDFLTMKVSRRLITMEKVLPYESANASLYQEITRKNSHLLKDHNELPGKYGTEGKRLTKADRRNLKRQVKEERRRKRKHESGSA